jgi:integrase
VRLSELWDRYKASPGYLDNVPSSRADAAGRAGILLAHFGQDFDVRTLTPDDVKTYITRRLKGGIEREDGRRLGPTRARSPQADLMLLRAMCRWAQTVRTTLGKRWLPDNPLLGVRLPSERNPRRPLADYGRLERTREAIAALAAQDEVPSRRRAWRMLDCALVIVEATGHRKGAVLKLDWADVDLAARVIRWRAENDKAGTEWRVPITDALARELSEYRQAMDAGCGPVFPSWRHPSRPIHPTALDHPLLRAEQAAKLPKLAGALWKCWRTSWASARKAHSLRDVMYAGGWRTPAVLGEVYQAADADSVRAVVEEPRKVRTT